MNAMISLTRRTLYGVTVFLFCFGANTTMAQEIVAHRGASADAPENTIAAFKLAWEKNADAIEGDFHLTRDGKIVCIHDGDTKKTAGKKWVVAKTDFEQLQKLDVGRWMGKSFADERIPLLHDVLATVPKGRKILIEVKCGVEIVPILKEQLEKCDLENEQMAIISFDKKVIAAAKKALPELKCYWLTSFKKNKLTGRWSPTLEDVIKTLKAIDADGLDAKAELEVIDQAFVSRLRKEKFEFHCWTVDDPDLARKMQKLGVDSITTNRPEFLRKQIKN